MLSFVVSSLRLYCPESCSEKDGILTDIKGSICSKKNNMAEDLKGSYIYNPFHPGKPGISAAGTSRSKVYHLSVVVYVNNKRKIFW